MLVSTAVVPEAGDVLIEGRSVGGHFAGESCEVLGETGTCFSGDEARDGYATGVECSRRVGLTAPPAVVHGPAPDYLSVCHESSIDDGDLMRRLRIAGCLLGRCAAS